MSGGATDVLARFVASAAPRDEDGPAVARSLADTRCAIVAGRSTRAGRMILATADELGDDGPASDAWRNAGTAAASALDDQGDYGAVGAPLWPALLALAESTGIRDDGPILEAGAIGIRAASALWRAGSYQQPERGFAGTRVFGVLAAAAACARLLGMDEAGVRRTLSIAASQAGGLLANAGTSADALHAASAARDGLIAASLAAAGVAGAPDILEGRQGFGEAFFGLAVSHLTGLSEALDAAPALGEVLRWKTVPGHIDHQRPVRVLAGMLGGKDPSTVVNVVIDGVPPTSDGNRYHDPATGEQAAASLRHALACVLAVGTVRLGDLDPSAGTAAARLGVVEVRSSPRWDPRLEDPTADARAITMRFADGSESVASVEEEPAEVSDAALRAKWMSVSAELGPAPDGALLARLAASFDRPVADAAR